MVRNYVKSFILTMRNVNVPSQITDALAQLSFILTMRNVNKLPIEQINQKTVGFILTMRNVNYYTSYTRSTR